MALFATMQRRFRHQLHAISHEEHRKRLRAWKDRCELHERVYVDSLRCYVMEPFLVALLRRLAGIHPVRAGLVKRRDREREREGREAVSPRSQLSWQECTGEEFSNAVRAIEDGFND